MPSNPLEKSCLLEVLPPITETVFHAMKAGPLRFELDEGCCEPLQHEPILGFGYKCTSVG